MNERRDEAVFQQTRKCKKCTQKESTIDQNKMNLRYPARRRSKLEAPPEAEIIRFEPKYLRQMPNRLRHGVGWCVLPRLVGIREEKEEEM